MTIEEQFNIIAKEYDCNRKKFISCFDEFYKLTTDFITSNINAPNRILDLGAGTGLLSYFWYLNFPESEYVLVDIAQDMINVAKKRFGGIDSIKYETLDYSEKFPQGDFDCIISALSIHHLSDEEKKSLFKRIYEKLPSEGIFVNYDQFCGGSPKMNRWFDSYWEKQLENCSLKQEDIRLWKERRKLDKECSVEKEIDMLKVCGFKEVKCVYSNQKFSVILAIR